ncbi:Leucine rich repeat-containing protein [Acetitomaculum ruminis DSM 5522]|uniref:Leucine rich repeat-containing protein n=1 Tax=Acetitomaculum ruminis DSM 5522 TaxID=1120918 RepID=A0A1I0WMI7_9FIRM|nr:leucine-rich repeat domain-containing protein [Acetitomaculum ruminis]SFA89597.1 Leucine rich repeat-containing protein [Acetitomaculum ruminis DSM 5522]
MKKEKIIIPLLLMFIFLNGFFCKSEAYALDGEKLSLKATGSEYGDLSYEIISDKDHNKTVTITGCDKNAKSVVIPEKIENYTVTKIASGAFLSCSKVISIKIPESVKEIGSKSFSNCTSLEEINIPTEVKDLQSGAFSGCSLLKNIKLPEDLKTVGAMAFYECKSLESIIIPEYVTWIGDSAFAGCESLKSVTLSKRLDTLGEYVFERCINLLDINVDEKNPKYLSIEGVLYSKNKDTLYKVPAAKEGEFEVNEDVKNVEPYAFYGCTKLTNIILTPKIENIGLSAFYGCASLDTVSIPSSVKSIGENAFFNCSNLSEIIVNEGNENYTSAEGVLFNKDATTLIICPPVKSGAYTVPETVENISKNAFNGSKLSEVIILEGVKNISNSAFINCSNLNKISVSAENTAYCSESGVLYDKDKSTLIKIPEKKTGGFTIPSSVVKIEANTYSGCNITSIAISARVTEIESGAFDNCKNLLSINVDNNNPAYSSLEGVLFDKLKTTLVKYPEGKAGAYIVPSSVKSIADAYMIGGTAITKLTIPASVKEIKKSGLVIDNAKNMEIIVVHGSKGEEFCRNNGLNYKVYGEVDPGEESEDPVLVLADKVAPYTGSPIEIDPIWASGVSNITYKYYTDSNCHILTSSESGAAGDGEAPVNIGEYYVVASGEFTNASGNKESLASNIAKLTIEKGDTIVSLSDFVTGYTGEAVEMTGAVVKGSSGAISYKYFSDSLCKKEISAPVEMGTYYVKAYVEEDENYKAGESNTARLIIDKYATKITLNDKTETYTGSELSIDPAVVEGSSGAVSYIYYMDNKCSQKTTTQKTGTSKEGGAPVKPGVYYVKAFVEEDETYRNAESNIAVLTIEKLESTVTIEDKTLTYDGNPAIIDEAVVTGSTGSVSYEYYNDEECLIKTNEKDNGSKTPGAAPVYGGTYYVKAFVEEDELYKSAQSNVAVLTVERLESTITIEDKTVIYNKNHVTMDNAVVTGSTGSIRYEYYKDQELKEKTNPLRDGSKDMGTAPSYGGTYYVKAYVEADHCYKEAESNIALLQVDKAETIITFYDMTTVYTGSSVVCQKPVVDGSTGRISYYFYLDEECKNEIAPPINAGVYYVKAFVEADQNYNEKLSDKATVTIEKSKCRVTLRDKRAIYTGEIININDPEIIGSYGNLRFEYYCDKDLKIKTTPDNNKSASEGGAPVNAGEYYVKAFVDEDDNYKASESNVAVLLIEKANTKITLNDTMVLYTGGAITLDAAIVEGSSGKVTYKFYKDEKGENELSQVVETGNYYVQAFVEEDENYKAASSKIVKLIVSNKITTITLNADAKLSKYYDKEPLELSKDSITIIGSVTEPDFKYFKDEKCKIPTDTESGSLVTGTAPVNAGKYYVKVYVDTDMEFVGAESEPIEINIYKAASSIEIKDDVKRERNFDGVGFYLSKSEFDIKGSSGNVTFTYYKDEKGINLTSKSDGARSDGEFPVNVGTYYVKAFLEEDNNYEAATSKIIEIQIVNPDRKKTTISLSDKTVFYTGKPVSIGKASVKGSTGEVTYTYYTDKACKKLTTSQNSDSITKGSAPAKVGIYYVKATVAADNNYLSAQSNIARLTIKSVGTKASSITLKAKTTAFTGKNIQVDKAVVKGSKGKVTYTYFTDKNCKKKTAKSTHGATSAGGAPKYTGTYYVKASLAQKDEYKAATSNVVKLVITKAKQVFSKVTAKKEVKLRSLKKASVSFKISATVKEKAKITFKKVSGDSKITLSSAGKVTVKKGLKKGTYKIKIKISSKATKDYKEGSITKTVSISVK